jgi:hypothetical protein
MHFSPAHACVITLIAFAGVTAPFNVAYAQSRRPQAPPVPHRRSVPEPSTILLVGAGTAAAIASRKFWRR